MLIPPNQPLASPLCEAGTKSGPSAEHGERIMLWAMESTEKKRENQTKVGAIAMMNKANASKTQPATMNGRLLPILCVLVSLYDPKAGAKKSEKKEPNIKAVLKAAPLFSSSVKWPIWEGTTTTNNGPQRKVHPNQYEANPACSPTVICLSSWSLLLS